MNWQAAVQLGCFIGVILCGIATIYWSRKSAVYHRITEKLFTKQPLTTREREIMENLRRERSH